MTLLEMLINYILFPFPMPTVPLRWDFTFCVFTTVILRDPRNPRDPALQNLAALSAFILLHMDVCATILSLIRNLFFFFDLDAAIRIPWAMNALTWKTYVK
jgi:hypothetical protein